MTPEEQVVDRLADTGNDPDEVAESLGLDETRVLEILVEAGYERCIICHYWCSTDEMSLVDDEHWCDECKEDQS